MDSSLKDLGVFVVKQRITVSSRANRFLQEFGNKVQQIKVNLQSCTCVSDWPILVHNLVYKYIFPS